MGKKCKKEESAGGAPAWMVTYGDMMTLLLTFFVLLLSFSTTETAKFKAAMVSLQGILGVGDKVDNSILQQPNSPSVTQGGQPTDLEDEKQEDMSETFEKMEALIEVIDSLQLNDQVKLIPDKEGVIIRINSETIFKSGSAVLDTEFYPLLDQIAYLTRLFNDDIVVEGHTDDLPISTKNFPSNWELSGARAGSIIRYLIETSGESPERFQLKGFAETEPIETNGTPEGRAINRRVEILIKNTPKKAIS